MTTATRAQTAPLPLDAAAGDVSATRSTWWSDTLVFAGRNVEHIRQLPEKLLDVTVQPLMFVLLFAYVFGGAIVVQGGSYREYVIAGILVQTLAFGLVGPASSISTDLTEGVIDRFRSLPVSRNAYLSGHYLAELGGMVLAICVMITAGLIVGWGINTGVGEASLGILLLLVFASAMIGVGTWIGLLVRTPDAVMGVAFLVVFPLTFLSTAFVPMASLPNALQWIAAWNPVSVVVAAVRELFGNPVAPITHHTWPLDHPEVAAFLYSFVILAVTTPAAIRRYRARTRD